MPFALIVVIGFTALSQEPAQKKTDDRQVLRDAVAYLQNIEPSSAKVKCLVRLAEAQARCGDREASVATYEAADRFNDDAAHVGFRWFGMGEIAISRARVGDIAGAKREIAKARECAGSLNEPVEKITLMQMIAEAFECLGDFPAAKAMHKEYITSSATSFTERLKSAALIEKTIARVDLVEAESLYRAAKSDEARKLVESVLSKAILRTGPGESDQAYLDVVIVQASAGDIAGVKRSAERISDKGESAFVKARALNWIAMVQWERGDREGAAESARGALLLVVPKKSAPMIAEEARTRGYDRVSKVMARSIEILADASGQDEAQKIVEGFESLYLRTAALTMIGEIRARDGKKDLAQAIFDQAETTLQQVEETGYKRHLANQLAIGRAKAGLLHDVDEYIKKAGSKQPDSLYQAFVEARAQGGDWKGAETLLTSISDPRNRAQARAKIALAMSIAGRADEGLELTKSGATDYEKLQCLINLADGVIQRVQDEAWKARIAKMK